MEPLTEDELTTALADLPAWELRDGGLHRVVVLADFREAISFVVRLAFEAERHNHHPELANVYNRVEVLWRTHDAGDAVTALDVQLAKATDRLAPPEG